MKNRIDKQNSASFIQTTQNISDLIKYRMDLYISTLYGIQGLFEASDTVTRNEFNKYVTTANIIERFPGISSFAYAKKILRKDISIFEQQMSIELTTKFATPTAFKIYPTSTRDIYYPVIYISPVDTEKAKSYGFDYLSEISRKSALEQAINQNTAIATGKIILTSTQKPGITITLPIYANNKPNDTIEQKQKNISGIIGATFRPENLFSSLFKETNQEDGINFEIFDGENPQNLNDERLIYSLDQGKFSHNPNYQPQLLNIKNITVAQKPWTIRFISLPNYELGDTADKLPLLILISGIDISLLLFVVILLINTSNIQAVNFAQTLINKYKAHDKLHSHTRVEPLKPQKPQV